MAKKKLAKKKKAKKKVAKKSSVASTKSSKRGTVHKTPNGYINQNGIILPADITNKPIPTSKMKTGLKKAKSEIKALIQSIVDTMADNYIIKEIELMASFNAEGKFLGIGIGGATSIKIKIAPDSNE